MEIEKIKERLVSEEVISPDLMDEINQMDSFEVARFLHLLSGTLKMELFQVLEDDQKKAAVLYETDKETREEIINTLTPETVAQILKGLENDEATDILKEQKEDLQEQILKEMEPEEAQTIKNLIRFDEETAGGLMNPEYNRVLEHHTASEILMRVKNDQNPNTLSYFYVVTRDNMFLGFFKLRDLLKVPPQATADTFVRKEKHFVHLEDSCEKIAALMDQEHLSSVPVVDENQIMHGIITFDDVIRVMEDMASEEIFTMVGTAKVDPFAQKIGKKVSSRIPWLLPTFFGGLISAYILQKFELSIQEFSTVLFFIPFVLGLAGNVGIQGATVIVRGLATGDIQEDNLKNVVWSEICVGLLNGMILGILCGIFICLVVAPLLNSTGTLGLAVGLGIILAVAAAGLFGSTIPIIFLQFKIDPAISTGPTITVVNDIIGLFIYLTTASICFSLF